MNTKIRNNVKKGGKSQKWSGSEILKIYRSSIFEGDLQTLFPVINSSSRARKIERRIDRFEKMKKVNFAICDEYELYCARLSEYLRNHLDLAFNIISFTKVDAMNSYFQGREAHLLLISEKSFKELDESEDCDRYKNVIILGGDPDPDVESAFKRDWEQAGYGYISEYLPAGRIVSEVLKFCSERPKVFGGIGIRGGNEGSRVLGFYSPLSRCGQTSLAVKMGEILSEKQKTVLISFESFSSLGSIFDEEPEQNLSDLFYYFELEPDCFCLNYERIKKNVNGLDIIPPTRTALQVREIGYEKVLELIRVLSERCGYENILLDLTEYPDGFFDILSACDEIFTVTRSAPEDVYRMDKYIEVLQSNGHEDILSSTVKCNLPHIRNREEYIQYIKELLYESLEEQRRGA